MSEKKSLRGLKTVETRTHRNLQNWHTCGSCIFRCISFFRLVAPKSQEKNSVFRSAPKDRNESPHFMENQKNLRRLILKYPGFFVEKWGLETPGFRSVSPRCQKGGSITHPWTAKKGVQLSTRRHTCMYIYIYACHLKSQISSSRPLPERKLESVWSCQVDLEKDMPRACGLALSPSLRQQDASGITYHATRAPQSACLARHGVCFPFPWRTSVPDWCRCASGTCCLTCGCSDLKLDLHSCERPLVASPAPWNLWHTRYTTQARPTSGIEMWVRNDLGVRTLQGLRSITEPSRAEDHSWPPHTFSPWTAMHMPRWFSTVGAYQVVNTTSATCDIDTTFLVSSWSFSFYARHGSPSFLAAEHHSEAVASILPSGGGGGEFALLFKHWNFLAEHSWLWDICLSMKNSSNRQRNVKGARPNWKRSRK